MMHSSDQSADQSIDQEMAKLGLHGEDLAGSGSESVTGSVSMSVDEDSSVLEEQHAFDPQHLYTDHVETTDTRGKRKFERVVSDRAASVQSSSKLEAVDANGVPYTRFSKNDKFLLVVICALSGFYSTIAQTIYFPALSVIEKEFNVSDGLVNITVVVYSLCQERGGYVGLTSGFQVLGSAIGGLLGALFTARWGWRSIFWFLAAGSGVTLAFVVLTLPETKRSIVGNGSIEPPLFINKSFLFCLPYYRRKLHLDNPDYSTKAETIKYDPKAPYKILIRPELISLLVVQGLQYTTWICHMTVLSQQLTKKYKLKMVIVGVCFLPAGLCTLTSIVTAGRFLNWNYRRRYRRHKEFVRAEKERLLKEHNYDTHVVDEIMENDIKYKFDSFKTRLDWIYMPIFISNAGFVTFGWCIGEKQPLAAVLVMSGLGSLTCNCIISICNTLVVDLYPDTSSTAAGCVNLVRCVFSAIILAALAKMDKSMKIGGTFTFLTATAIACSTLLIIPLRYGLQLQLARQQRENAKKPNEEGLDENNIDPDNSEEEQELYDLRRAATAQSNISAL
ncbi:Quinidine resistance protein 2 [Kluyveromyces marxianus]